MDGSIELVVHDHACVFDSAAIERNVASAAGFVIIQHIIVPFIFRVSQRCSDQTDDPNHTAPRHFSFPKASRWCFRPACVSKKLSQASVKRNCKLFRWLVEMIRASVHPCILASSDRLDRLVLCICTQCVLGRSDCAIVWTRPAMRTCRGTSNTKCLMFRADV